MTDAPYKAAIVGLGYIGGADQVSGDALGQLVEDLDGTHIETLSKHPKVEVVAGSSRDLGRRERFTERTGIRTYADWREIIEKEDLDIVGVATYTPVHEEITVACAQRGIRAILCEKPISPTVAAGENMVKACENAGSLLVINHNRRFNPNYRRLRDLIAEGGLGELTSVTAQWPSGRLGNVGTHVFDAIYLITGRRFEAVAGTLDLAGKPDCRGIRFSGPGGLGPDAPGGRSDHNGGRDGLRHGTHAYCTQRYRGKGFHRRRRGEDPVLGRTSGQLAQPPSTSHFHGRGRRRNRPVARRWNDFPLSSH